MSKLFHMVRQYLNGVRTFEKLRLYQLLGVVMALVHLVFCGVFFSLEIYPLAVYNVGVVLFYLLEVVMIAKFSKPTVFFVFSLCEIMFHSVMATVLCGWDWGFMLYTIGLVSLAFYMCFTLSYVKRGLRIAFAVTIAIYLIYFFTLAMTNRISPIYGDISEHVKNSMYYFNTFLSFGFILFVSVLFSAEVRFMQRNLESENKTLSEDANFDPLTHLHNRRSMNDILKERVTEAQSKDKHFSLLMIDIDSFKAVNDTYGHEMGDEVLIEVATIIKEEVREEDVVCRWGGEEILVLVDDSYQVAVTVAERIRKAVANHLFRLDEKVVHITITIGAAEYTEGDTIRELVASADERMYYGKQHGKNRVVGRVS
ncbi:MAG: GGDEF domain-containing protein [Lachnospiraceae bacterium]|nr:GGDEF domain-containing protein [Lachnospiraceae bacterium]